MTIKLSDLFWSLWGSKLYRSAQVTFISRAFPCFIQAPCFIVPTALTSSMAVLTSCCNRWRFSCLLVFMSGVEKDHSPASAFWISSDASYFLSVLTLLRPPSGPLTRGTAGPLCSIPCTLLPRTCQTVWVSCHCHQVWGCLRTLEAQTILGGESVPFFQ